MEMEKENDFIQDILKQVNQQGIESISLQKMLRFKQIMRRRLDVFIDLKTQIETSGILTKKALTAEDSQLKQELRSTFKQIRDINTLKNPFYTNSSSGMELATKSLSCYNRWGRTPFPRSN